MSTLKEKLRICLGRIHRIDEVCGKPCTPPLSVSLNASLIVFDFFQIISFRLPLSILEPPSLSQRSSLPFSQGSVFLSLSLLSLPLNAYSIDVFLSITAPVMPFLLLALLFVSHLLFVKGSLQCFLPRYTLSDACGCIDIPGVSPSFERLRPALRSVLKLLMENTLSMSTLKGLYIFTAKQIYSQRHIKTSIPCYRQAGNTLCYN